MSEIRQIIASSFKFTNMMSLLLTQGHSYGPKYPYTVYFKTKVSMLRRRSRRCVSLHNNKQTTMKGE